MSQESFENGYRALFDERLRAAHIALLLHARATEPTRWPTIPMVHGIARVFGVPAVELGAFFGLFCRMENGKELWVDVFRKQPGTTTAIRLMTKRQAVAFGMMEALTNG